MMIILLIIIIILQIIYQLKNRNCNECGHNHGYRGRPNNSKDRKIQYYYGSSRKITMLKIHPMQLIGGKEATVVTDSMSTALLFIPRWDNQDILYNIYNGIEYAIELRHGAFDKLKVPGYINFVDSGLFQTKLSKNEFISYENTPVDRSKYVGNVFAELKSLNEIKLVTLEEILEKTITRG